MPRAREDLLTDYRPQEFIPARTQPFTDAEYELLGAIALTYEISDYQEARQERTRLIRQLCNGDVPRRPGQSYHNAQIEYLNTYYPGWNTPLPEID